LETAYGAIEVGVREGTAAWLDVSSGSGSVHNSLTASEGPEQSEDTVKIRARTRYGNIDVRRAAPESPLLTPFQPSPAFGFSLPVQPRFQPSIGGSHAFICHAHVQKQ